MEYERRIYLDHNATTPLHPEVKKVLTESAELYGNASSMHTPGREAHHAIETSRQNIAAFLNCNPEELMFTSSGSEANNTVINSIYCCNGTCSTCSSSTEKPHIITSTIEHPSVMQTLKCYEKKNIDVTQVPVSPGGIIDPDDVKKAIRPSTKLITVMLANNEIGTIQPVKEITEIAHQRGILMHTDAVQAVGKIPVDLKKLDVDFMTMSGHKIYAPKGIGVLYIKRRSAICPLIYGGHHELNRRAGTENTIGILALGKAVEMRKQEYKEEEVRLLRLKKKLREGFSKRLENISFNGDPEKTLSSTLNVSFDFVEGESILLYADMEGMYVSTGSACSTGSLEPSHVITALGAPHEKAHGSIRFSMGRETTDEDIDYILERFPPIIKRLRQMSPLSR